MQTDRDFLYLTCEEVARVINTKGALAQVESLLAKFRASCGVPGQPQSGVYDEDLRSQEHVTEHMWRRYIKLREMFRDGIDRIMLEAQHDLRVSPPRLVLRYRDEQLWFGMDRVWELKPEVQHMQVALGKNFAARLE